MFLSRAVKKAKSEFNKRYIYINIPAIFVKFSFLIANNICKQIVNRISIKN